MQVDARPGGFQRFTLVSDEDPALRSTVDVSFTDVVENELLDGHQEIEGTPGTRIRLRLEFRAEGHGKTRLDLWQGPFAEELGRAAKTGWDSSFTRLDSLLRRSL